jgi:UDP-glucose 4-epimerase
MLAGRRPTVFGDGRQSRDFTYVENVVDGNLRAADNPNAAGQVFNVACGKQFSLLQLIDGINEVLNTNLKPSFKPARPGDVLNSVADISLAQEILGYEPRVGFEEGLKRSVEYYRRLVI